MTAVFVKILNMSLTAGYCIGVVLILRVLLRRQAKIFSYLLWGVVLFRLLCPVTLTSSYSLLRMDTAVVFGEGFSGGQQEVWQGKGYLSDGTDGSAVKVQPSVSVTQAQEKGMAQMALGVGAWVWIAGVLFLLCYSFGMAVRLRRFLSAARPVEEEVYEIDGIATPFVFGMVRPRIYLPARLSPTERRYVLVHERAHIARKDYLIKLIGWGAACLHWFNPLVWFSFRLLESDMEMSCDETVLRRLGEEAKQEYSRTLLALSCAEPGFHASPVAFSEGGLKKRIQNILSWKRGRIVTAAVLAVLLCALTVGLMLNPAGRTQKEQTEEKLRFLNTYANAYCDRNGDVMAGLYIDEKTALESVILMEKAGGTYTFGLSSPWPNEFHYMLTEELGEGGTDTDRAEIWYYAWTSDPHVTVWKEELQFTETADGYRVTDSDVRFLDSIASRADFDEAYLIAGEYRFTDYEERGFLEGIQVQTEYDRESGGADRNAVYRSPDTAVAWIFNLTGGSAVTVSTDADGHATVRYTFGDGSSVVIPMYNAAYRNTTENSGEADGGAGTAEDVWFPDLEAWKDYEYYVM